MSERKGTKALELWCKRLIKDCPDIQIDNMTTSWRNGMAFCALVHHFRPDLIDMKNLKPENIYENNQLAFTIAEKHLGITALLDPEDMVENDVPDRLSILTYLSQFYQRLGHTVNTKSSTCESDNIPTPSLTHSMAPMKFGKTGLDKCAACGLPVYLAQRLLVSHKLYHRRCFRCSKCSGHLNPNNFEFIDGSDFLCDSCKNEKTLSKYLNNNDQMGMLAFTHEMPENVEEPIEEPITPTPRPKPQSILDKISMFENVEKSRNIDSKLEKLDLKDYDIKNQKDNISTCNIDSTKENKAQSVMSGYTETDYNSVSTKETKTNVNEAEEVDTPVKEYKSDINKSIFLQTQLSGDTKDLDDNNDNKDVDNKINKQNCCGDNDLKNDIMETDMSINVLKQDYNVTDDVRLAKNNNVTDRNSPIEEEVVKSHESNIVVPPRKKKVSNSPDKKVETHTERTNKSSACEKKDDKQYPDHLNPFSDDESEESPKEVPKKKSTNPFGSTDEEDDDVPPIHPPPAMPPGVPSLTPVKRVIHANPFWSDDEEPSSDDDGTQNQSSKIHNSSLNTSTPNISSSGQRRRHKKGKAPPPPTLKVTECMGPASSMDDVASISSLSSYNSTLHSDQKSVGKITPMLKKRFAPTPPPDSLSTTSGGHGSMEKGVDSIHRHDTSSDGQSRRVKGPAPGLPLPERREVKLQVSPQELQVQLDMLETQQLGLERQGVLIEQMIRDKCEGDDSVSVPQEEVEDLVIQLCELVNEKNDLFRKQTELMYIRRQQRLEQEQADIEHEIRVIQSRPAVNRCDADKAREEQLVARLVSVVRLRDELVQQMDAERRRERQEDLAIAASIASKRAQRNSESNSSSIKSGEVLVPKKNKVRDKVKKQLKKAKHSLIPKKKDDKEKNEKEDTAEKKPK